ncbi:hypothetical protein TNCV_1374911 [Trichonephila clavipes]|nr:hypothetical protein TNCV_1374911 [Trichonephila clavipes]
MTPHTITPAAGAVCCSIGKAKLRHSSWGLRTRTRLLSLLKLSLDSSLKTTWFHSVAVQSRRARHHLTILELQEAIEQNSDKGCFPVGVTPLWSLGKRDGRPLGSKRHGFSPKVFQRPTSSLS